MEKLSLHEELVEEVLCRLPKKSLARFKCVSKQWLSLISDRNRVFPKTTTHLGLVFQRFLALPSGIDRTLLLELEFFHVDSSPLSFFRVDSEGGARLACCNLISNEDGNSQLVGSCNGFLLLRKEGEGADEYVVCHPATKRSWHLSAPPTNQNWGIHVSLVSDSHHFKFLRFSGPEGGPGGVGYTADVFCSENEDWSRRMWWYSQNEELSMEELDYWRREESQREKWGYMIEFTAARWKIERVEIRKSVFLRGDLHWISLNYLCICQVEGGDFTLIRLPRFPYDGHHRDRQNKLLWNPDRGTQCIWGSEGRVSYCKVSADKIGIWTLHKGDWNDGQNEFSFKWLLKHEGILAPPAVENEHPISFYPFAFNDDFEIVYMMGRGRVFSYNLATKEMKEACTSPFEGSHDCGLCIAFSFSHVIPIDIKSTTTWDRKVYIHSQRRKMLKK